MPSISLARACLLCLLPLLLTSPALSIGEKDEDDPPMSARLINDEGGPVVITGELNYTNAFFSSGVDDPIIILEDQAGFVDRNEAFIIPLESQVLGQITSDYFTSPFSFSLSLPLAPKGSLRDVDNDGEDDTGVMIFALAHWTNIFDGPLLDKCDQRGGGWSTAYASTRASDEPETRLEIIGGKFIIYAPAAGQGFPAGFGADGLLFTADDPIVTVPPGYSVVDMDERPFVFDRAARPVVDLYEPEAAALNDFSALSYSEAFAKMLDLFRREYAYTDLYELDWQALEATYAPRFAEAEAAGEDERSAAFALALRDFIWEIPDGHVSMPLSALSDLFREETDGGLGLSLTELDDGRVVVSYLIEGGPAANAGMELGAEILAWDGGALDEALDKEFVWAHQALATEHTKRLQQLRYITRFPLGAEVEVTFRNPESEAEQSAALGVISERASFSNSSFFAGIEGDELPIETRILPSGYGYVAIYAFSDDERLTATLWERMIESFIDEEVPGIIIDMRKNSGGSGYLADQLAAYFFQEEHILGYSEFYNDATGEFTLSQRPDQFCLPGEDMRYDGEVLVITAPGCFSACEFFAYNMTIDDRAAIIGHYPTGGLGGAVDDFLMPDDIEIRFTVTRQLDPDLNIHIEAQGVAPTVVVPVTYDSLFDDGDLLLKAAEEHLTSQILGELIDGGELSLGVGSTELLAQGKVGPDQRVRYRVTLPANRVVSVFLSGADETVDTVLGIYDSEGSRLLGENDDADDETLSSAWTDLEVGAQPGAFTFEARVKNASKVETFTIKVLGVESEDSESESADDTGESAESDDADDSADE